MAPVSGAAHKPGGAAASTPDTKTAAGKAGGRAAGTPAHTTADAAERAASADTLRGAKDPDAPKAGSSAAKHAKDGAAASTPAGKPAGTAGSDGADAGASAVGSTPTGAKGATAAKAAKAAKASKASKDAHTAGGKVPAPAAGKDGLPGVGSSGSTPVDQRTPSAGEGAQLTAELDADRAAVEHASAARDTSRSALQAEVDRINQQRHDDWRQFRRDHPQLRDPDVVNPPRPISADDLASYAEAQNRAEDAAAHPTKPGGVFGGAIHLPGGATSKNPPTNKSPLGAAPGDAAVGADTLDIGVRPTPHMDARSGLPIDSSWMSDTDVAALKGAVGDYKAADRAMRDSTYKVEQFMSDHADLAQYFGQRNIDATRNYWKAHGIDVGDASVEQWDDSSYPNAHYNPSKDNFAFGALDGDIPNVNGETQHVALAIADDVVDHEATHRVLHTVIKGFDEGENATAQTGAIDESIADTMAAAQDGDFGVGEDVRAGGLRHMDDPTITISDYDPNEPHSGAAVPNAAAARIGTAVGFDQMGDIYAYTIQHHLPADASFEDLARGTYLSAVELYGADSSQAKAVRDSWDTVLEQHGSDRLFNGFGGGSSGVGSGGGGGAGGSF